MNLKNPYGLKDGQLVTASQVARGLNCGCICPACEWKLQAHQGSQKRNYFSHYKGSDCGAGYETALHVLAKNILLEEKRILLPKLEVFSDKSIARPGTCRESEVLVKSWKKIDLDSVVLEKRLGRIIPDVIVIAKDRVLIVEIKVTHGIDEEKLTYIQSENLNVIEFDFSKARGIVDKDHIRRVMTETYQGAKKGVGKGEWLHHDRMRETIEKLNKQYIDKNSAYQDKQKPVTRENNPYKPYHRDIS